MPLDHYVSQVHLRNFSSPALKPGRLWGIRKQDQAVFPCSTRDVCRIENGSTNPYLQEPRAIEEFLRTIEPHYNAALAKFREGKPDISAVYVMAGFIAYVSTCSPTAMRIHSGPVRASVDATARIVEKRGDLPPLPEELKALGCDTFEQLLDQGHIDIEIDEKYPQSIGIASILERIKSLGNFGWELLHNSIEDSPFLTSDYPVAIERTARNQIVLTVVPLAPDFAVRIVPDFEKRPENLEFPRFRFRHFRLTREQVRQVNTSIVRCSESLVFARDQTPWLVPFVKRHHDYHLTSRTERIPVPKGHMLLTQLRVERQRTPREAL